MALWEREYYYKLANVDDRSLELDYLTSNLHRMNLETVDWFIVDAVTENRADLISLKFFGNYHFGWLIGMHNDIENLVTGFPIGKKVAIPSLDDYYRFYNRNTRAHYDRI